PDYLRLQAELARVKRELKKLNTRHRALARRFQTRSNELARAQKRTQALEVYIRKLVDEMRENLMIDVRKDMAPPGLFP
ncbi:MAG: hypothetical protein Q8P45_02580, partial [Candidatus Harrisonbacteria bacterium]|nr:hypothetical protein [Candidatus Harrisonbacteria bacterium]